MGKHRVFILKGAHDLRDKLNPEVVVVTPEPMDLPDIQASWTYACINTSPGFNRLDYQAALKRLQEQNPTWMIIEGGAANAPFSPRMLEKYEYQKTKSRPETKED